MIGAIHAAKLSRLMKNPLKKIDDSRLNHRKLDCLAIRCVRSHTGASALSDTAVCCTRSASTPGA